MRAAHHKIDGLFDAGYGFIKNFIVIESDFTSGKLILRVTTVRIRKDLDAVAVCVGDSLNPITVLNDSRSVVHVDSPARRRARRIDHCIKITTVVGVVPDGAADGVGDVFVVRSGKARGI